MRFGIATVFLLFACAPHVARDGFRVVDWRDAACFVMRERPDTLPTSAFRRPASRILLEQYARQKVGRGYVWFYSDSVRPQRTMWGGWLRRGADTVEVHTGTYPTAHYRLAQSARGALLGRGVMASDAYFNGHAPTFTWVAQLEPMACSALSQ